MSRGVAKPTLFHMRPQGSTHAALPLALQQLPDMTRPTPCSWGL